jgi:recombination protein RecT
MGEIVTTQKKAENLRQLIGSQYKAMAAALPKHITAERMARVALSAATKRPALLDCDPNTFVQAMLEAATLGLEPEVAGQCWILPYGKTATFIAGYRGLLQLVWRSGELATMGAEVVYEKDVFKYAKYPPKLEHVPYRGEDHGNMVAAYAFATLKNGGEMWVVMEAFEIEAIKKRSPAAKSASSPWTHADDVKWMWKKTVLRQLLKFLPMSVEIQRVVDNDERADSGLPQSFEFPLDPKNEVKTPAPEGGNAEEPKKNAKPAPSAAGNGGVNSGNAYD